MRRTVLHVIDLRSPAPMLDWSIAACRATAEKIEADHQFCIIGPSERDRRVETLGLFPHARIRTTDRAWPTLGRSLRSLTRAAAPSLSGVLSWSAQVSWLVRRSTPWSVPVAFVPMDVPVEAASFESIPILSLPRPPREERHAALRVPPGALAISMLAGDACSRSAWQFVFLAGYCEPSGRSAAAILPNRTGPALGAALRFHHASRRPEHILLTALPDPHAAVLCDAAVWLPSEADPSAACTPAVLTGVASLASSGVPVIAPACRAIESLARALPGAPLFLATNQSTPELARVIDLALSGRFSASPPARPPVPSHRVPEQLIDRIEKALGRRAPPSRRARPLPVYQEATA